MSRYEFDAPRLHVDAPLGPGAQAPLSREQANYLLNVLRLGDGDRILVFNGSDGEWSARVQARSRRDASLIAQERTRPQTPAGRIDCLFAPLKHARLDYLVQKMVEMGAARLAPTMTRRTQASRVNIERMRANAVEAAEQCGVLALPAIDEPAPLERRLSALGPDDALVFCDEDEGVADPASVLRARGAPSGRIALLIGPEGGFDEAERRMVRALPQTVVVSLGPRILRADTAAVAALAAVQIGWGDWR